MTNNACNISSSGILVEELDGTFSSTELVSGSTKITISDGDGILDTPTIDADETVFTLGNISGTLSVSKGGTGVTSNTAYAVLCGGTTSTGAIQSIASVGSSNQALLSNDAGALPTFQTISTGRWTFISTGTASNSSSIDFTNLSSTYQAYVVIANNISPVSDPTELWFRTSTNNGGAYDSGVSDYSWFNIKDFQNTVVGTQTTGDNADSKILLVNGIGTSANEITDLILYIINPSGTQYTKIMCYANYFDFGTQGCYMQSFGTRLSAADVDAIRFLCGTGNIDTGTFKLYGINAS